MVQACENCRFLFELILRLKGNYLWPAMWGRAFYDDDPLNPVSQATSNFNMPNDGDSDYDGLSLDVPERVTVPAPAEGTWTLIVDGFTIWEGRDTYYLFTNLD